MNKTAVITGASRGIGKPGRALAGRPCSLLLAFAVADRRLAVLFEDQVRLLVRRRAGALEGVALLAGVEGGAGDATPAKEGLDATGLGLGAGTGSKGGKEGGGKAEEALVHGAIL